MRYLITFSYDGSHFHGFQRLKNQKSIQGTLEKILSNYLNENILIEGSGRTDAFVHAMNQCATFNTHKLLTRKDILNLNKLLNKEIKIKRIKKVPSSFHARYSAKGKVYVYKIYNGKLPKDKENYYLEVSYKLDINKMKKCAKILEGRHDYHNFVSGKRDDYHTVIKRIKIKKIGKYIYLIFDGVGFYRYMVRHLVGAILDVGRNHASIKDIVNMLNYPEKEKNLSVSPAQGLYLIKVKF